MTRTFSDSQDLGEYAKLVALHSPAQRSDDDGQPASNYTARNLYIESPTGTTYAYRRFGRRGNPPVLFLQHFRGNLDNWDPALVDDIALEHDVILLDNSGVGLSTGTPGRTIKDLADDVLTFVDALQLSTIDLFGFSTGGFVAQELVLTRPQLVRRLVLAGTGPEGGRGFHPWSEQIRSHAYRDVQNGDDAAYLFFSATTTSQAKGVEFLGRIFSRSEDRDTTPSLAARDAQAQAITLWGIPDAGKFTRLDAISQPTLVANGNNDIMVPTKNSYLLAGHIPDAELLIYPDSGHGFLFQYPTEFAAEVNRFLSDT